MNILGIDYTLKTSSIDIYVSGCKGPHCKNCHNPQSWDFNDGVVWDDDLLKTIENKILTYRSLVKNIIIFGGEPLDQDYDELRDFLESIEDFNLPIWIFTRYNFEDIPHFVKNIASYIKTGRYEEDLICNNKQYGITLATSNQKIWKKGIDY